MKLIPWLLASLAVAASCSVVELEDSVNTGSSGSKKLRFDVLVTRDGQLIDANRMGIMSTKGSEVSTAEMMATMNTEIPFGLIGIDAFTNKVIIDNKKVDSYSDGRWNASFNSYLWDGVDKVNFSAYYPYVGAVGYGDGNSTYSIAYSVNEIDAGPLVSKTVQKAVAQLDMVPLVFQHVTDDIGFRVCDATPDANLQGLIHLRKVIARNVASAGIYVDTLSSGNGMWKRQAYFRDVVVFDGDAKVGVGSQNERFLGFDSLVDRMAESHRFYAVPDDVEIGKQYVEVHYDVDEFSVNGFTYAALEDHVAKYMIYGLLPDNTMEYGKQYTFHIGLDLSNVYPEITFAPSVSDWETKIYENNTDF